MAKGRTYINSYADQCMKEDLIKEVGSFLEELIVKDIAPLKMIKKDFPITNPSIRKLRDLKPSVSYETIREFCYIIGYYLHEEENAVRNGEKHLDDKNDWLNYLSDLKERYLGIYGRSAKFVMSLIEDNIDIRKMVKTK